MQINVQNVSYDTIKDSSTVHTSSKELYVNVMKAYNSTMPSNEVDHFCPLSVNATVLLKQAFERLGLSMRGYHKIIKVASTIADLEQSAIIEAIHMQEAIMYRSLDKHLESI